VNYALIVNPADLETPLEDLRVKVLVKVSGYMRDALLTAKRIPDSHSPVGHAWLVIAGSLLS